MNTPFKAKIRAFTLIELLTVMALFGVLAVAAIPAVGGLGSSGRATQNLVLVSETLERAREYAVSRNTYTWVAWTEDTPVTMAAFASVDGSRAGVDMASATAVPGSADALTAIDRLQKLEYGEIQQTLPPGNSLLGDIPASSAFVTGPKFTYNQRNFTRSLMFTPAGEARVSAALPENIQLVFVPMKGDTRDTAAASVVQISGLTGRVKVYRP
jgi:prepilin-type N-terminal cleavage/methylation domain-containing protein